ncbi:hypothetical protein BWQ96_07350 [Gracilariopsis chorda]|uniref:Uncharacterized protein n=1 Tax=Gracilariopsis chorda TaxID=448386 RepID=A0A2V3ILH1_9FLOR|nr:hypothetical protein BWQ96_07350 [Gracilariopsis chorda]|eukprot:PXF42903.1 hypothetical protein BWQ96_07350 [Gracilariopsis chorda]
MSFAEDLPLEQAHHFVQKLRASLWAIRRHLPSVRLVDRAGGARFTRHPRVRFVRDEKVRLSEWLSGLGGLQRFPPASAFDPTMRERLMMEVDSFLAAESVIRERISLACPTELQIQAATSRTVSGQPLFMRNASEGVMVFAATFNVAKQIGANEVVLSTEVAACADEAVSHFSSEEAGRWFGGSGRASLGWSSAGERVSVGVVGEQANSVLLNALPALLKVVQLVGANALWIEDVRLRIDGAHVKRLIHSIRDALQAALCAEVAGVNCSSLRGVLEKWLALCFDQRVVLTAA